jgi:alpha-mannosidase
MPPTTVIHVVSHTHWDREWHQDFQGFRRRLVGLIDHLLDLLAAGPEYRHYHLDGQTLPLADYLAIRPERAAELREHIAAGRLLVGPFFILPDEFLVSGEATVRNLLLGTREARGWGGVMPVGYCPDTFGHLSQLPQILRGFGIDNAVLFRGVTYDQTKSELWWESPDGSRVLCLKLPDEFAYSSFYYECEPIINVPGDEVDPHLALECMTRLRQKAEEHATTRHLLAMDGVDHIYPSAKTLGIIAAANAGMPDAEVIHTSLPAYIGAVQAEIGELDVWRGEMRVANRAFRLQALLAGTLSSWMPLKQENWACQTELERWAEPMTALAGALDDGPARERGFLREAWRELLLNHPHDSICGCSIDEVHRDMRYRSRQSLRIAQDSAKRGMEQIAARIDTSWVPEGAQAVVVLNSLGWSREDLTFAAIDFPADQHVQWFRLRDAEGNEVPLQRISTEQRHFLRQEPHNIPRGVAVTRHQIAFRTAVPGLGYKVLAAVPEPGPIRSQLPFAKDPADERWAGSQPWGGAFEDGGDVGDGYNYVAPERDGVVSREQSLEATLEAGGMLFTRERWDYTLTVPRSATPDAKGRSEETVALPISVWMTMPEGEDGVYFRVRVENTARDHRLRMVWPAYPKGGTIRAFAESQFDLVERPVRLPDTSDWIEPQPPTHPQQSFCGVECVEGAGTTWVANRGLPEYETRADREGRFAQICVTLLRCVGRGVGQPEQFVDSQLLGPHEFHLAAFRTQTENAKTPWREAHNYNAPLRIVQTSRHAGDLPPEASLIALSDDTLCVTALKPAEDRDSLILRVVNYGPSTEFTLTSALPAQPRFLCNLAEERLEELTSAPIPIAAKQIATIELA